MNSLTQLSTKQADYTEIPSTKKRYIIDPIHLCMYHYIVSEINNNGQYNLNLLKLKSKL